MYPFCSSRLRHSAYTESLSANKDVNQQVMRFTPFITPPQKKTRYFLYSLLRHDVRDSILTFHSELLELDRYQLLH